MTDETPPRAPDESSASPREMTDETSPQAPDESPASPREMTDKTPSRVPDESSAPLRETPSDTPLQAPDESSASPREAPSDTPPSDTPPLDTPSRAPDKSSARASGAPSTPGFFARIGAWPWRKILFGLLALFVVACMGAVLAVVLTIRHFSEGLPDVTTLEQNYKPPQVTRILARDGSLLANVFSERRTVVPFERVPDHVKSAFLAAEDAGFYEHEGLDYLGLVRAMVVNLRAGHVRQGGSTITQQVIKNVLLDSERSYRRKIRETILAYRIEKYLTKEQILGMYMNHIYLGHGRYGVEEAARFYFGKHVEELDVGEAALIAGIVAAPERYSPRKSEEKSIVRRRYVLGQMRGKGFATDEVFDAYVDAPIRLAPSVETESDIAPEMLRHTRRLLEELAPDEARKGGFTVRTTINPELQVSARKALRKGLDGYLVRQRLKPPFTLKKRRLWGDLFEGTPRRHGIYVGKVVARNDDTGTLDVRVGNLTGRVYLNSEERYNPKHLLPTKFVGEEAALRVRVLDEPDTGTEDDPVRLRLELGPQGALVALNVRTREVIAVAGSYEAQNGGLDRSVQARRQPGSTFKPVFYNYAISTGAVTPATQFEFPLEAKERKKLEAERAKLEEAGEELPEMPETVEMSLREGIAKSDNRVAREVFRLVGARQVVGWAKALGFTSRLEADVSLALGSYEVTPLEMASAYAVFASGGRVLEPHFFTSVESGRGVLELPAVPPAREVMEPQVAYVTTNLLESVVEYGTGRRAKTLGRPLAGKTGTTNKAKDAWFVGYSPEIVVAVWVGFDDAQPLGWGEAGASSALPIWMDFMKAAHKGKPVAAFPRPAGVVTAEIDPATGLLARYGQEDSKKEIFVAGTEPTETAPLPTDEDGADEDVGDEPGDDESGDDEPGDELGDDEPGDDEPGDPPRGDSSASDDQPGDIATEGAPSEPSADDGSEPDVDQPPPF